MAASGTSVSVVSSGKAADADQGVTVISIRGKFGYKNLKNHHHEGTKNTKFYFFVSRQLLHALLYLLHPCSRSW
jgi:hypothetical protein